MASESPTSAERGFPDGFYWGLGLISAHFETQQRIPKLSAEWFREAARQNAVF